MMTERMQIAWWRFRARFEPVPPPSRKPPGPRAKADWATLVDRIAAKSVIGMVPQGTGLTTPCIEWTGARRGRGRPVINVDGIGNQFVARLHVLRAAGVLLPGWQANHRCHNLGCIAPDHLYVGTHADNMADRNAAGRQARPRGVLNGQAKLTDAQALEIFHAVGTQRAIARQFCVSQFVVWKIKSGRGWRHIHEQPEAKPGE